MLRGTANDDPPPRLSIARRKPSLMKLRSTLWVTALALPVLACGRERPETRAGDTVADTVPQASVATRDTTPPASALTTIAACDTIARVLRTLQPEAITPWAGRVAANARPGYQPPCGAEARGDVHSLPAASQPHVALTAALGWPIEPRPASDDAFSAKLTMRRGGVVCYVLSAWNGASGGAARGLPPYSYRITVHCEPEVAQIVAPAPSPPATTAVPGPVGAPQDSVTKRPVPAPAPELPTRERVLGPFTWRGSEVRCVVTEAWLGPDTTVAALRVIDAHNAVLYQATFSVAAGTTGLEEQLGVVPVLLEASDGAALMLNEDYVPSAPMGGASRKLLAWKDGRMQPLSPALTVYGEFANLPKGDKPSTVRLLRGNLMPIHVWAYSFVVLVSLEVRLTAFAAGDAEPLRPALQIDTLSGLAVLPISDPVLSSPQHREEAQRVMLYRSPTGSAGEAVQVRRTSQIQYGPAYGRVRLDRDAQGRFVSIEAGVVRLRVTIDGKTGFVEANDFSAIGLGSAG